MVIFRGDISRFNRGGLQPVLAERRFGARMDAASSPALPSQKRGFRAVRIIPDMVVHRVLDVHRLNRESLRFAANFNSSQPVETRTNREQKVKLTTSQ